MNKAPRRIRRPAKRTPKKQFVPSSEPRALQEDVELVEGKSARKASGGIGGRYWHIRYHDKRAGRVYIDYHEKLGHPRPSITVELNQQCRGHGIGTIAFRKACELSQYNEIYASVRKGNIASRHALGRAGFKPVG